MTEIVICEVCDKPIYEGHIDCTCEKSHPSRTRDCGDYESSDVDYGNFAEHLQ